MIPHGSLPAISVVGLTLYMSNYAIVDKWIVQSNNDNGFNGWMKHLWGYLDSGLWNKQTVTSWFTMTQDWIYGQKWNTAKQTFIADVSCYSVPLHSVARLSNPLSFCVIVNDNRL